jgi:hypothetical protein
VPSGSTVRFQDMRPLIEVLRPGPTEGPVVLLCAVQARIEQSHLELDRLKDG